ncbi:hypothetical protein M885DRAFT_517439 [Pelagophyceae sp. CCMP2097]|nr:hypothetical protein M885DRAFT_517439 [Pelagophyceae sp. CCMP2097]
MTGEELQRRCVAAEAPHTGGLRAVFTISTGGYDVASISDVAYDDEDGIDYLLFCDGGPLGSCEQLRLRAARRWRIVEVPLTAFESCGGDALCVSRDVKLRPHLYLDPKYAKSIYVDANVRIVASPAPLFGAVGGGIDFASFEYDRGIKDEADHAYLYLRRAHRLRETKLAAKLRFRIRAQVKAYGKIPKTGYGKVLVRAHTTRTCKFSEVWWHEFANGVPRDQLSLLWAAGAAKRHGFVRASLNLGPGPRKCTCAADDVNFQAFFQHMGNSRKQGARKTAPGA